MDADRARELARAALTNLEAHRRRIDDLNVYPVPDGDTGTNLTLTVRAIVERLEKSRAAANGEVAEEIADAALRGARGNSGVILSQIVGGFATVAGQHDAIDGDVLARAFRAASNAAYRAVPEPAEGTMLTVVREMAEEAEEPPVRGLPAAEALRRVVARGERAVERTPELLDVLAQAGVVDAGGAGLLEIVRGVAAALAGEPLPEAPIETDELGDDAIHQELSRYRYCTTFVVDGEELDADGLKRELGQLGDSLLVVGHAAALKVHVHTDDPGAALAVGTRVGVIDDVEIANMHRQALAREERLSEPAAPLRVRSTALVAVVAGEGNARIISDLADGAARIVHGGQTMNPSTEEIARAVEAAPGDAVLVLPNNGNVIGAARLAVESVSKPARVIPTRSIPAGIGVVVSFNPDFGLEENERTMLDTLADISTGEVTVARRTVDVDGVHVEAGSWFGLVDDRAVASDADFDAVVDAVVERLVGSGDRSTLIALVGVEGPDQEALRGRLESRHPEVELDVRYGGQPHYPLLLAAE
jgi:DAK2 domain fusion protein YloV